MKLLILAALFPLFAKSQDTCQTVLDITVGKSTWVRHVIGYVVKKDGKVIEFLNYRKRKFKKNVTVRRW